MLTDSMYAAFVKKYQETKIYPFLFVLLVNDYQKLTHNNFYLDASHHSLNLSTHHILHHSQTHLLIATKHYASDERTRRLRTSVARTPGRFAPSCPSALSHRRHMQTRSIRRRCRSNELIVDLAAHIIREGLLEAKMYGLGLGGGGGGDRGGHVMVSCPRTRTWRRYHA